MIVKVRVLLATDFRMFWGITPCPVAPEESGLVGTTIYVAAGLGPTKEGRFLLPGADRRLADVFVPHWAGGLDVALDVTVINPLQAATLQGAATTPGHTLTWAY